MSHLYGLGAGAAGLGLTAAKLPPASAAIKGRAKYKKAPGAPKRFKSAFIFFSTAKHKEIRKKLGAEGNGTEKVRPVIVIWYLACRESNSISLIQTTSLAHLLFYCTFCIDYQRGQASFRSLERTVKGGSRKVGRHGQGRPCSLRRRT